MAVPIVRKSNPSFIIEVFPKAGLKWIRSANGHSLTGLNNYGKARARPESPVPASENDWPIPGCNTCSKFGIIVASLCT